MNTLADTMQKSKIFGDAKPREGKPEDLEPAAPPPAAEETN